MTVVCCGMRCAPFGPSPLVQRFPKQASRAFTFQKIDGRDEPGDVFDAGVYSHGVNYLGLPAGVVPVELIENLPAGVQIIGRRFRVDLILDAMEAVEGHVGMLVRSLWARESYASRR